MYSNTIIVRVDYNPNAVHFLIQDIKYHLQNHRYFRWTSFYFSLFVTRLLLILYYDFYTYCTESGRVQ